MKIRKSFLIRREHQMTEKIKFLHSFEKKKKAVFSVGMGSD